MNCEKMRAMLDAYIDGELSAEEMRALRDHAAACEDCKKELEAAELVRDALAHMDEGVTVPLEAQAAWRKAVRAEANKRGRKRALRVVYGLAAALAVAIGCTAALRSDALNPQNAATMDAGVQPRGVELSAMIASDGESDAVQAARNLSSEDYSAWKKYGVADFDRACQTLEELTAEYSGTAVSDNADGEVLSAREAMYRIELPATYMEDFLNAASLLGTELDSELQDETGETAILYIQMVEQRTE